MVTLVLHATQVAQHAMVFQIQIAPHALVGNSFTGQANVLTAVILLLLPKMRAHMIAVSILAKTQSTSIRMVLVKALALLHFSQVLLKGESRCVASPAPLANSIIHIMLPVPPLVTLPSRVFLKTLIPTIASGPVLLVNSISKMELVLPHALHLWFKVVLLQVSTLVILPAQVVISIMKTEAARQLVVLLTSRQPLQME